MVVVIWLSPALEVSCLFHCYKSLMIFCRYSDNYLIREGERDGGRETEGGGRNGGKKERDGARGLIMNEFYFCVLSARLR